MNNLDLITMLWLYERLREKFKFNQLLAEAMKKQDRRLLVTLVRLRLNEEI